MRPISVIRVSGLASNTHVSLKCIEKKKLAKDERACAGFISKDSTQAFMSTEHRDAWRVCFLLLAM